jgi:hypothetical protein
MRGAEHDNDCSSLASRLVISIITVRSDPDTSAQETTSYLCVRSAAQVPCALKQAQCGITVILPWNSFRTTSGTEVAYSRFSTPTYFMLHNLNVTKH